MRIGDFSMGTIPKTIKLAFKPIGTDAITRTRIKQFWSENGESNTQRLTDAAQKVIYDAIEFIPEEPYIFDEYNFNELE